MKRAGIWILLFFLWSVSVYGAEPVVNAQGAALIDGNSGRLLWGRNAEKPLTMASTTKIMTAILILEHGNLDDVVTISKNAARQPEVHMDLKEGEEWRVGDLLQAMMLRSYNDTAVALAEHVSGSVEAFCAEMTAKAKEIGALDTVFGSPNGLDSQLAFEDHHSTAYDMALIGAYALKNQEFRDIVALSEITISEKNGKRQCQVTNTDRFLREYEGALGIKTGYTNKAGHCFVGAAQREDICLVTAVLGSGWGNQGKEAKWTDTKKLMEYGFANFFYYDVAEAGQELGSIPVLHSKMTEVAVQLQAGYGGLFSDEEQKKIQITIDLPEQIEAPVALGEPMGKAVISLEGVVLAEIPVVAKYGAEAYRLADWLWILAENWVNWADAL